jgi:glycolate oxidase FAD binding subunit
MSEAGVAEIQERIRDAAADERALRIRGGGTKDFYGRRIDGELLDVRGVRGIVDYEPTELVNTARAGTPLDELDGTLQAAGQMLAFEPPRFAPGATLGGTIGAGLAGPRRAYAGGVRDFVLGVRLVDGTGEALGFGGKVMKNVAGFDVSRLVTGALGTLGVVTEVSLKCLPRPATELTLVRECAADQAIHLCNDWGGKPVPLSATCFVGDRLHVRLSGAEAAVRNGRDAIGGEALDPAQADDLWRGIRDHAHPFFASTRASGVLWRLSVRSTTPYADLGGPQLIEWGGALRWLAAGAETNAEAVRAWARASGGHASCFRGNAAPVFQPLPPTLLALHQRLKHVFDPHGILNRGRLYPEL